MNHLRQTLGLLFLLMFTRVAGADVPFRGSWYRDDAGSNRSIRTQITFGDDGTFSMVFFQLPKDGEPGAPIQETEGRWSFEEGVIVIRIPSTAPVGVLPREDAKFRWEVVAVSPDSLSTCEQSGTACFDWKRSGERIQEPEADAGKTPDTISTLVPGVAHP